MNRNRTAMDEGWMRQAIGLASRGIGRTSPNPAVGAIVVKGGRIVGRGWHRRAGADHAEVEALREAGPRAAGATLYVTLEPCCTWGRTPPCTAAIVRGGISRVVAAVRDPNPKHRGRGLAILRRAGLRVTEGVCPREARQLIVPFAKWITTGMPYVTLKLATSLDGKIADSAGKSKWISSPQSRAIVMTLRRRADAVLVGSGTVLADDPSLLPGRRSGGRPVRVVADSVGSVPLSAQILNDCRANRTLIATTARCPAARAAAYVGKGAAVWRLPARNGRVSLRALFRKMAAAGIVHVLCEGGGTVAETLVRENLVDEYVLFIAPRIIGGRSAVAAVAGKGWPLARAPRLRITEVRNTGGGDLLLRLVDANERNADNMG